MKFTSLSQELETTSSFKGGKRQAVRFTVYLISALMVLSTLMVFSSSAGEVMQQNAITAANQAVTVEVNDPSEASSNDAVTILKALSDNNVPAKFAYLPNFAAARTGTTVAPYYTSAPAPMGVADYGIMTSSGLIQKYQYDATGISGSAMFEGITPFYLMNSAPGSVAIQLNAVLNGTTILGQPDQIFWVHAVGLYTPAAGTVQMISNVWDISTPGFEFPSGAILQGNGAMVPGVFYYYGGPTLILPPEGTLILSLETSVVDNQVIVNFGYDISNAEATSATTATYDTVVFNSALPDSSIATRPAYFHVDGYRTTPSGLLYDAEFVATGPGSGSTTVSYFANDQFKLSYISGATLAYTTVPAAYNYGSNTGETISGLSVWYTSAKNPIAHLSQGPSILAPLWGSALSKAGGAVNIQGTVQPANAFVFINPGTTYDPTRAAWAPINANGTYKFSMPGGLEYSGAVMLSDYTMFTFTPTTYSGNTTEEEGGGSSHNTSGGQHGQYGGGGKGGHGGGEDTNETALYFNVTMSFSLEQGIYTPLYANGNEQLQYLTVGNNLTGNVTGNGTLEAPYILETGKPVSLDPLFTKTNTYLYPEFAGIQLMNTNASVLISNPPEYQVHFPTYMTSSFGSSAFPTSNYLGYQFYNTSGVTFYGANMIRGWLPASMQNLPVANVAFLDSTDFLVANSYFSVTGSSLTIYNSNGVSGNGTVWGNHFIADTSATDSYAKNLLNSGLPTALSVFSSGNLIYNNYFDATRSAYSPGFDPLTGSIEHEYENQWNLPEKQNLSYVNPVHGFNLSGAIVEVNYQGGNYWYNFDGSIPYNDSGNIATGGDYYPLVLPTYTVTFNAIGLPSDMTYSVTFHGKHASGNGHLGATFEAPKGTHYFTVIKPSSYSVSPISGAVTVNDQPVTIDLVFSLIQFDVTFQETGLPSGSQWTVVFNGVSFSSNTDSISFLKENGTWSYSITGPENYSTPAPGTLVIDGNSVSQAVSFVYIVYQVTFQEIGLPNGELWTINFDGMEYTTALDSVTIAAQNGTYDYTISTSWDGTSTPSSGTVTVLGGSTTVGVAFTVNTYSVGFQSKGIPAGTPWEITFNGVTINTTDPWIYFQVPNGNYTYVVSNIPGYAANVTSGYVIVDHAGTSLSVDFVQVETPVSTSGTSAFPVTLVAAIVGAGAVAAFLALLLIRRHGA